MTIWYFIQTKHGKIWTSILAWQLFMNEWMDKQTEVDPVLIEQTLSKEPLPYLVHVVLCFPHHHNTLSFLSPIYQAEQTVAPQPVSK